MIISVIEVTLEYIDANLAGFPVNTKSLSVDCVEGIGCFTAGLGWLHIPTSLVVELFYDTFNTSLGTFLTPECLALQGVLL